MTQIVLDSFYTHKAEPNKTRYFQCDAGQEFRLKITRSEGFPYLDSKVCKQG
jgi:hypothetical protein